MSLELTPIWHSFWMKSRKYVWKKPWRVRPSNQGLGWLDGADVLPNSNPQWNLSILLFSPISMHPGQPHKASHGKPWETPPSKSICFFVSLRTRYGWKSLKFEALKSRVEFIRWGYFFAHSTLRWNISTPVVTFLPTLSYDETFPSPWSHYLACIQVGPSTFETACRWNLYCGPLLPVCVHVHMHKCAWNLCVTFMKIG